MTASIGPSWLMVYYTINNSQISVLKKQVIFYSCQWLNRGALLLIVSTQGIRPRGSTVCDTAISGWSSIGYSSVGWPHRALGTSPFLLPLGTTHVTSTHILFSQASHVAMAEFRRVGTYSLPMCQEGLETQKYWQDYHQQCADYQTQQAQNTYFQIYTRYLRCLSTF